MPVWGIGTGPRIVRFGCVAKFVSRQTIKKKIIQIGQEMAKFEVRTAYMAARLVVVCLATAGGGNGSYKGRNSLSRPACCLREINSVVSPA